MPKQNKMVFFKDLYYHFARSNTFEKGAALSYYAAFSILPILMILISIIGVVFPYDFITEELSIKLTSIVGEKGASQLEDIIKNQHLYNDNILTTIIGITTLILAATGMFNQIQKSLNSIWGIKVKDKKTITNYFLRRLTSFIILVFIGFILFLSTAINSFLFKFASQLPDAFSNAHVYENIFPLLSLV